MTTTAIDTRPTCNSCGCYMELRGGFNGRGNGSTAEQRWCGVWYDHPTREFGTHGHTASVLLPSPELLATVA